MIVNYLSPVECSYVAAKVFSLQAHFRLRKYGRNLTDNTDTETIHGRGNAGSSKIIFQKKKMFEIESERKRSLISAQLKFISLIGGCK